MPVQVNVPPPTNLHQAASAAECLSHVPNGGQGFFEHDAYGCSHPTPGYVTLVWDFTSQADGFHVYRVDGTRRDYGIHHDGTMALVSSSGFACFVVTAVRGSSESQDSNRYCVVPHIDRISTANNIPAPTSQPSASAALAQEPAAVKAHELSAAELRADVFRLNRTMTGKSHSIVKNPYLMHQNLRIITDLQHLRARADQEFAQMRAMPGFVMVRTAPTIGPSKTFSESGSNGGPHGAVGYGRPVKSVQSRTESSFVFSQQVELNPCAFYSDPIIQTVNGSKAMTFTPTQAYDLYTIEGCHFGTFNANAAVWMYKAGLKLDFQILSWNDSGITVMLDPNLSGIQDQKNLTLVVQRADGKQTQASGFGFYAARNEVQLTVIPSVWVTLLPWDSSDSRYASPIASQLFVPQSAKGSSNFVDRPVLAKSSGGLDTYDFSQLPEGWLAETVSWTTYDEWCPGVVTYKQDFGSWVVRCSVGNGFQFQWGETTGRNYVFGLAAKSVSMGGLVLERRPIGIRLAGVPRRPARHGKSPTSLRFPPGVSLRRRLIRADRIVVACGNA